MADTKKKKVKDMSPEEFLKKYKEEMGEVPPKSKEDAEREMEGFFKKLEDHLKDLPEEEVEEGAKRVWDFAQGKLSWAEMLECSPEMLFQIAEHGLAQFKVGRYEDAERIFKMLTVLDWDNAYYHSVMGSILQRQKRYGEAIAEYDVALDLVPDDITSLTNKGEIYMLHGLIDEAKECFDKAIDLDPDAEDRWANRARVLRIEIERQGEQEKEGQPEKKKASESKH